jgi:hypothetical protein
MTRSFCGANESASDVGRDLLDTVLVTAKRRTEDDQSIPVAVTSASATRGANGIGSSTHHRVVIQRARLSERIMAEFRQRLAHFARAAKRTCAVVRGAAPPSWVTLAPSARTCPVQGANYGQINKGSAGVAAPCIM